MMVDAPQGWGIGNSGRAYMQWYQPLDRHEKFRTLVSSHLTWLVEFSWLFRFLYLLAWSSVLTLCMSSSKGWRAIPFCIWSAFLIAAFFSSIAESIWLWVIPIASLLVALRVQFVEETWPRRQVWLTPLIAASVISVGLFLIGSKSGTPTIHGSPDQIVVGNGTPKVWVVVNAQILGDNFGKKIRQSFPSSSSIGFVRTISQLNPVGGETVVICGNASPEELLRLRAILPKCGKLILLNPTFYPQDLPIIPSKCNVLIGDLSQTPIDAWSAVLGQSTSQLKGVGDYIDNWPQFVFPKDR